MIIIDLFSLLWTLTRKLNYNRFLFFELQCGYADQQDKIPELYAPASLGSKTFGPSQFKLSIYAKELLAVDFAFSSHIIFCGNHLMYLCLDSNLEKRLRLQSLLFLLKNCHPLSQTFLSNTKPSPKCLSYLLQKCSSSLLVEFFL